MDACEYIRNGNTQQEPKKRIQRANLPHQIKNHIGIVPNFHVERTVDHHADAKFHGGDSNGAGSAAKNQRRVWKFAVDRTDQRKTNAACDHHAWMGISAPYHLD